MINDIIKAMKERRSIRNFKADMPAKADIEQIIIAGFMPRMSGVTGQQ